MKKLFTTVLAFLLLFLSSCGNNMGSESSETTDQFKLTKDDFYYYERIEPVGETPSEFEHIVKEDLFDSTFAAHGIAAKIERINDEYSIKVYDYYGRILGGFELQKKAGYIDPQIYPTSDGNLLAVCAPSSYYGAYNQSDMTNGEKSSRITKFDINGNLLFETETEDLFSRYQHSFVESDSSYIFACYSNTASADGTITSNIYLTKLSLEGKITVKRSIESQNYSILNYAEEVDGKIRLHTRVHTYENGKTLKSHYLLDLDSDFNIISQTPADENCYIGKSFGYLGLLDGKPLYDITKFIADFDAGSVKSIIDYGDSVLVISNRLYASQKRGEKMNPISHHETVYSSYSKAGKLIWRDANASSGYIFYIE